VEEVKSLPLDGYQAMLNIRLLGGKWVPFFFIVFGSRFEKNISEWYFISITEEEEDFVVVVHAIMSKGNAIVSSHSLVCAFYN
jgi:hypothetical protein